MGVMFLRAANLESAGVPHGFGTRNSSAAPGVRLAVQVHGARVLCADESTHSASGGAEHSASGGAGDSANASGAGDNASAGGAEMPGAASTGEADALYATQPGVAVGVVTADCVPILLAALEQDAAAPGETSARVRIAGVAAIHAGWRGLAAGVIEAGVSALHRAAPGAVIHAAIGPHIGPCCYEVDAPVLTALFGAPAPNTAASNSAAAALRPTRPGHFLLNLGALAQNALARAGVSAPHIATIPRPCTRCAPHFASHRRDGPRAGRMTHWIAVPYWKGDGDCLAV